MDTERLRAYHRQRLEDLRRENDMAKRGSRNLTWALFPGLLIFVAVWFYLLFVAETGNRLGLVLIGYGFILALMGAMDLVTRSTIRRTDAEIRALDALLSAS